jgi:hypothetical protein
MYLHSEPGFVEGLTVVGFLGAPDVSLALLDKDVGIARSLLEEIRPTISRPFESNGRLR